MQSYFPSSKNSSFLLHHHHYHLRLLSHLFFFTLSFISLCSQTFSHVSLFSPLLSVSLLHHSFIQTNNSSDTVLSRPCLQWLLCQKYSIIVRETQRNEYSYSPRLSSCEGWVTLSGCWVTVVRVVSTVITNGRAVQDLPAHWPVTNDTDNVDAGTNEYYN